MVDRRALARSLVLPEKVKKRKATLSEAIALDLVLSRGNMPIR
jgi:hypothetical protein